MSSTKKLKNAALKFRKNYPELYAKYSYNCFQLAQIIKSCNDDK